LQTVETLVEIKQSWWGGVQTDFRLLSGQIWSTLMTSSSRSNSSKNRMGGLEKPLNSNVSEMWVVLV